MSFELKKLVLEATEYVSGYVNEDDNYVISASMIGKDPLQNYLSLVHGKIHTEEIDDTTLGSIFHRGMEEIVLDKMKVDATINNNVKTEHPMSWILNNGWVLSGTADLIVNHGGGKFSIHDHKLSKMYAKKMMKKELHSHDYTKQLQALEALFRKTMGGGAEITGDVDLFVEFFAKDAKAIEFEPTYEQVKMPNKRGTEETNGTNVTFMSIIEITDSLQAYIEAGEVPPQCKDLWWRVHKTKRIPTKCALYCSHGKAGLCPHYNPSTRTEVERLTNW